MCSNPQSRIEKDSMTKNQSSQSTGTLSLEFDSNSKEYKLSTAVSGRTVDIVSNCIGDVLAYLEASLPENSQTEALKKLIKERLYMVTREIQHQVYYAFGIEPYQLGDGMYIQDVLTSLDMTPTYPSPTLSK